MGSKVHPVREHFLDEVLRLCDYPTDTSEWGHTDKTGTGIWERNLASTSGLQDQGWASGPGSAVVFGLGSRIAEEDEIK